MTGCFFVALFPYELMQSRVLTALCNALSVSVDVSSSTFSIPIGATWHKVKFRLSDGIRFEADRADLTLDIWSIFRGRPRLKVVVEEKADVPILESELELDALSAHAGARLTGRWKRIELSKATGGRMQTGILNGTIAYQWASFSDADNFLNGTGTVAIELTGMTRGHDSGWPALGASISALHGLLDCDRGVCRIVEMKAEGIGERLTGEGTLMLRTPVKDSVLAVTLRFTTIHHVNNGPAEAYSMSSEGLKLRLNGPLDRLEMSL
jgi:type II secretion system protein N